MMSISLVSYFGCGAVVAVIATIIALCLEKLFNEDTNKTKKEIMEESFRVISITFFGMLLFYPIAIGFLAVGIAIILFLLFFRMLFSVLEYIYSKTISVAMKLDNHLRKTKYD